MIFLWQTFLKRGDEVGFLFTEKIIHIFTKILLKKYYICSEIHRKQMMI